MKYCNGIPRLPWGYGHLSSITDLDKVWGIKMGRALLTMNEETQAVDAMTEEAISLVNNVQKLTITTADPDDSEEEPFTL